MTHVREHILSLTRATEIAPSGNWIVDCKDYTQVTAELNEFWWNKILWCRENIPDIDYAWNARGVFVFTHAYDATAFRLRFYDKS